MATTKKLLQAAAGNAGGALNVEDVFSAYLYYPTGNTHTVTNGIDLSGEGGLVWLKNRLTSSNHELADTERGVTKKLSSNSNSAEDSLGDLSAFNSDGFSLTSNNGNAVYNTAEVASWTFLKSKRFFDIQTFSGDGATTRTLSHNLSAEVGMMIIKSRSTSAQGEWWVYHRSMDANPETKQMQLSENYGANNAGNVFGATKPTSTQFSVGSGSNYSGQDYIVYLFAHNDGDGEFGPDADQDAIKCGSYTGNGSATGPVIDLGFEPQWVLIKETSATGNWQLFDSMRGMVADGVDARIAPNLSNAEDSIQSLTPTATGFKINTTSGNLNTNNSDHIYIAIRRPTAVPTSATEVFAISQQLNTSGGTPSYNSGFPVDMAINKYTTGTDAGTADRLRGARDLQPAYNFAEYANSVKTFDYMDGYYNPGAGANSNYYSWMWKRAPNFFDVVAYTGDGTAGRTVSHNLGVAPEMMWVKDRDDAEDWSVYHAGITNPEQNYLYLNSTSALNPNSNTIRYWNHTAPTDSVFTLGDEGRVNQSGENYIAYLFASLAGISKVGSASHSGTTNVDCGFTSGARFVLLKRTDATGDWYVWDSERGIVSGNDPYLLLNTTGAEVTNTDYIDPLSSGFTITSSFTAGDYIFYAVS